MQDKMRLPVYLLEKLLSSTETEVTVTVISSGGNVMVCKKGKTDGIEFWDVEFNPED